MSFFPPWPNHTSSCIFRSLDALVLEISRRESNQSRRAAEEALNHQTLHHKHVAFGVPGRSFAQRFWRNTPPRVYEVSIIGFSVGIHTRTPTAARRFGIDAFCAGECRTRMQTLKKGNFLECLLSTTTLLLSAAILMFVHDKKKKVTKWNCPHPPC